VAVKGGPCKNSPWEGLRKGILRWQVKEVLQDGVGL